MGTFCCISLDIDFFVFSNLVADLARPEIDPFRTTETVASRPAEQTRFPNAVDVSEQTRAKESVFEFRLNSS
jgi:hypothetical protein